MAKAKEITGIDCAADALLWAAEVLRVRFEEVLDARGAALDFSDTEGVHQMRVATRRLRSALRDFTPLMNKRPSKRLRKELKRLADALGAVRDQDVAIAALEALQTEAETDSIKTGIGRIIAERNRLREAAQTVLTDALAPHNLDDLHIRFSAAIDKAARQKKSKRTVSFSEAGRAAVADGLDDLGDLGASLYEPFSVEPLHEMRIAAKRLRYAVELFTACWGEKIASFAEEVAELQTLLGEVHDSDVWIENLSERLRGFQKKAAPEKDDFQTAAWLMSEFVKTRTKNYRAALRLWSEWETNDFAGRMRTIVETA